MTAVEAPIPVADVGLTFLSDPKDAVIDIVFVHGLQGHPQDTWTYKSKTAQTPQGRGLSPSTAAKSNKKRTTGLFLKLRRRTRLEPSTSEEVDVDQEDGTREQNGQRNDVFWPRDLLKDDFPMARIMTFGYNTNITRGYQAANQGNIFSHARDLLYELEAYRRNVADRHLVFIAHSLGGILVKEVLRRSQIDPDTTIKKIFISTTGIFFFGTPHRGSKEWASFGEGVAGVAGRLLGIDTNDQVIRALSGGPELELCQESFTSQWVSRGNSLVVRTFQESKGVTGVRWGGFNEKIVPPDSSSLDHPNQRATTIEEDHIGMVKFRGSNDKAYRMLKVDIKELVEKSQRAEDTRFNMTREEYECVQHLRLTDPRDDKKRIEDTKGGLLGDSYRWILENPEFQRWRNSDQARLLWIKGDPGKGKTMLLCGIIKELEVFKAETDVLSYFFCQAMDSRINTATSVLRGLLFSLVNQQQALVSHIWKKYAYAGKALFEDANAWTALSEIFSSILEDQDLKNTYLIIDALDECIIDLPKLLEFVIQKSSMSSRVKWIISSRNWPDIEERLAMVGHKVRLSLELNAQSISTAVNVFIRHKVHQLAELKRYKDETKDMALNYLLSNAHDTFLWVALVCQNLENIPRWNIAAKLKAFPPGLDSLYEQMMQQIRASEHVDLCKRILGSIVLVYRPIMLQELASLVEIEATADDLESIRDIVSHCGSFLTLREDTIYFVHQSAKDFLSEKVFRDIFPSGEEEVHRIIFSRSLQAMIRSLHRDMYSLGELGYSIDQVKRPDPDPLAALRYSCIYWIDHLHDYSPNSTTNNDTSLQDKGPIDEFLQTRYLYWLEALSLCQSMSKGVVSMTRLMALVQERADASFLSKLVQDARRFIMYHKVAIEKSPLQVYASALLFSPKRSLIRCLFKEEEPRWITKKPSMIDGWTPCLQTLEGHRNDVISVAFSPDSKWLASVSYDNTAKIWDLSSGTCSQTLEDYSNVVSSIAFSPDSKWLALVLYDSTVKIWDLSSGTYSQTLEGHSDWVTSVAFSPESKWLASASHDRTVKIWDLSSGACSHTLDISYPSSVIAFDTSGSCLHTETGPIEISPALCLKTTIDTQLQKPAYQTLALSSDQVWVTLNSSKLLRLPSEYRPSCSAVLGNMMCVGTWSGKVWIFKVES